MHSWIKSWPSVLTEEHKLGVMDLFEYFCPPLLHFLRYSGIRVSYDRIDYFFYFFTFSVRFHIHENIVID